MVPLGRRANRAAGVGARPYSEPMRAPLVDGFGRVHTDLRLSLTDRCNLRCTYCMPEEGMQWLPRSEVLTFEEMRHITRIFVERFEVDGIRLTGGEPTVRAHLPELVQQLATLRVPADFRAALAAARASGRAPDLGAALALALHARGLDRDADGAALAAALTPMRLA